MRCFIALFIGLLFVPVLAQDALFGEETQTVRALVIGISDYQNQDIKDLNFADDDALAFAGYLQKIAKIPAENIRVLTNDQATSFRMSEELSWLIERSAKGDKAIIYFSGHGDKETTTSSQLGFLLTYNSPAANYFGGGAFDIGWLKAAINTLSVDKEVEVLVISDACRSGKISSSRTEGIGAATAALAAKFGLEGKILSCEEDQFSEEGTQWGGGRGAFSYHLINGLIGLADADKDGQVTLHEIERYLEDNVPKEVAPKKQKPFTVGSSGMVIAVVVPEELAKLKEDMQYVTPTFEATASRGFEEQVIADSGPEVQRIYKAYQSAISEKRFLDPENDCADFYYQQLMKSDQISSIHPDISRHFAAKLQEGSQAAYDLFSSSDSLQLAQNFKKDPLFSKYPQFLEKAAEILGSEHYMYKTLKGRASYFNGLVKKLEYQLQTPNEELLANAYSAQEEALQYEEGNPHAYYELGMLKLNNGAFEEAKTHFEYAMELAPFWGPPYEGLAECYFYLGQIPEATAVAEAGLEIVEDPETRSFLFQNLAMYYKAAGALDLALETLLRAVELGSEDPYTWYQIGQHFQEFGMWEEAVGYYEVALELDPEASYILSAIGWCHQGDLKFELARGFYEKAYADNLTDPWYSYYMGTNYFYQNDYDRAAEYFDNIKDIYPVGEQSSFFRAFIYNQKKDYENAVTTYYQVIAYNPYTYFAHHNLSIILENQGKEAEAFDVIQEGLVYHPYDFFVNYQLARLLYMRGDLKTAEKHYQTALQDRPKSSFTLRNLAMIYRSWGQEDKAQQYELDAALYNTNY